GAFEDFPFGPEVMVYKVMGKMFALVFWGESSLRINLKCDPDLAMHFRDGSIPDDEIHVMIDDSYSLVVRGLKKTDRKNLAMIN
ncbi:MAG: MmcQ/YjbR family DNA-binding protein, partial [Deltaproteobacteria bacterium]|nr:MmcQ/YjbR family DNA-binding protein [Deltaproteobacteria bacterium]